MFAALCFGARPHRNKRFQGKRNIMITPRATMRLLGLTITLTAIATPATTGAGSTESERYADQQILISHAKPVQQRSSRTSRSGKVLVPRRAPSQAADTVANTQPVAAPRRSLVAQAAHGQALSDPPEAPLDGSLIQEDVRQVGFLEDFGHECGPVCDCGMAAGADPACGIEPVCGIEPACGIEPGYVVGPGYPVAAGGVIDATCGAETVCDSGWNSDCGCNACTSAAGVDCFPLFLPILRVNWCRFEFFAGTQGFKAPLNYANTAGTGSNRNGSGSFGFHQGFNEGRSLKRLLGWDTAAQFGVRATQNNLSGAEFTDDSRYQVFVTGGLFRRVDYGLQYGAVIDYLNEDWYFQGDLIQLRGELSWKTRGCHNFGFKFMTGLNDNESETIVRNATGGLVRGDVAFESMDQYRLFYRRLLNAGGSWSTYVGWTDEDNALFGNDLELPLRRNLSFSAGYTYVVGDNDNAGLDNEHEAWNLSIGMVYRPGGPYGAGRYNRPLFDVADNGSFIVRRR